MENTTKKLETGGPASLDDVELLGCVLGAGGKGRNLEKICCVLKESLWLYRKNFGSFYRTMLKTEGLGAVRAAALIAALELGHRLSGTNAVSVRQARDILPYVSFLNGKKQECFVSLNLDGANRVLSSRIVTIGLVDQALVHPREVFCEAVKERAVKIIVAHNHPAGILGPSPEDIRITNNLLEASRILGITLVDHIIVTEDGYYSFREQGLL
jgi:DNA repair protein RadC